MGYTMATAVCNKCGARRRIIERHGASKPGTTVNMWCVCAKTPDGRFAHTPHTIADGNNGPPKRPMLAADTPLADVHTDSGNNRPPKRPMVTAICHDCGHKRRVGQQEKKHNLGDRLNIPCSNRNSDHKGKCMIHIVIDETAAMRCDDCGHKTQLIRPAKTRANGTKIGYICWACPERDDNGWAILHPHTVMSGNEDPTYPLMTAACDECGHERRFMDAYECEPGTRLTLDCQNRDAGHFWKNRPHTVVTIGATA